MNGPADPAAARSAAARLRQAAAHGVVLALAAALFADVLAATHMRLWPDRGYGLLVVAFAGLTAFAAIVRSLGGLDPDKGESLVAGLGAGGRLRLLAFLGVWGLYAASFSVIGFLPATTLALAASAVAVARVSPWAALPAGAALSLGVWLLFQRVLYVSLPFGPAERWLTTLLSSIARG